MKLTTTMLDRNDYLVILRGYPTNANSIVFSRMMIYKMFTKSDINLWGELKL